jgi:GT2 family glycosyltransferase
MCAHNEAGVIERQLRALAVQESDEPWELVVVDHRSTDATSQVTESFRAHFPDLTILQLNSGLGLAHARNSGVRVAQGSKIVMCDADDEVQPGWLLAMSRALAIHDIVGARMDPVSINPAWLIRTRGLVQTQEIPTYLGATWSCGAGLGFRRVVFDKLGGFDERLVGGGEDTDFGVRASAAGFCTAFVPDAVVRYRFRAGATSAYRQGRGYGNGEALLLIKHGARSDRRAWWRNNAIELLRLPPLTATIPFQRSRLDRRIRKVAFARRAGRMLGRMQGAIKHGCPPW